MMKPACTIIKNEKGYVLVATLLALMAMTATGLWALNTSVFEVDIAANLQQWEEDFNTTEGGTKTEGAKVGYARSDAHSHYQVTDPEEFDQFLLPLNEDYDPGEDVTVDGDYPDDFNTDNPNSWPHANLANDNADNTYDYAYRVTYLFPDKPPKGYDVTKFAGYRFRVNSENKTHVEVGGMKVGVKSSI